jgi:hypothetical protein
VLPGLCLVLLRLQGRDREGPRHDSKRQDLEAYENHLTTLPKQGVGAAATGNVEVRLQDVSGRLEWR